MKQGAIGVLTASLCLAACVANGQTLSPTFKRAAVSHGTIATYTPQQCADLHGKLEAEKVAALSVITGGECRRNNQKCAEAFEAKNAAQRAMELVGAWCGDTGRGQTVRSE